MHSFILRDLIKNINRTHVSNKDENPCEGWSNSKNNTWENFFPVLVNEISRKSHGFLFLLWIIL